MEKRFLLDRVEMHRARPAVNKAVIDTPPIFANAAVSAMPFNHDTAPWTQSASDATVVEFIIIVCFMFWLGIRFRSGRWNCKGATGKAGTQTREEPAPGNLFWMNFRVFRFHFNA